MFSVSAICCRPKREFQSLTWNIWCNHIAARARCQRYTAYRFYHNNYYWFNPNICYFGMTQKYLGNSAVWRSFSLFVILLEILYNFLDSFVALSSNTRFRIGRVFSVFGATLYIYLSMQMLRNLTSRCLAVTGGGSVVKCGRLSSWEQ